MSRAKIVSLVAIVTGLVLVMGLASCSKEEGLKIKRIEPHQGSYEGGDIVTIHGSGFQEGGTRQVDVFFGGNKARQISFDSDSKLVISTPGGKKDQKVDVVLIFGDSRRIEIKDAYKYIDPTAGFGLDEMTEADKALEKKKKK